MTIAQFLIEFQDLLQIDEEISLDDKLKDLEEWDSMSVMACMVWLDKHFNLSYSFSEINELKIVQDIVTLSKGNIK